MNQLFFTKLSEKVKKCNHKEIKDYDFDGADFSSAEFQSAWFEIHTMPYVENYNVTIRENGKVYLTQGDANICPITGKDAQKWTKMAKEIFLDRFADDIQEAKEEDAHWSWVEHQDNIGHLQTHDY